MARKTRKMLLQENEELLVKANAFDEMHGKYLVEKARSRKYLIEMAQMAIELKKGDI